MGVSEQEIIERFGSLSSAAIQRILDAGEDVIKQRWEDGVFE